METTESCNYCEKIELLIETIKPIIDPLELPNTFRQKTRTYVWKHTDCMAYAMIPRSVKGSSAQVDLFLCIDEDMLDDIDVHGYARKFLNDVVLPKWKNVKNVQLVEPLLSSPEGVRCWKFHHESRGEEAGMPVTIQE